jgi:RNA methyltransferase, TrmH family
MNSQFAPLEPKRLKDTEFTLYGWNSCMQFFKNRPDDLCRLFFSKQRSSALGSVKKWCAAKKLPYRELDLDSLNKVASAKHHEGIVMVIRPVIPPSVYPFIKNGLGKKGIAVALDCIGNTHNLGAILRTSAFFGVEGVVISNQEGQARLTSSAARTAEGAMEITPIYQCTDLASILRDFMSKNIYVIGTDLNARKSLYDVEIRFPCVVVFGNEQDGLSSNVKKRCDQVVRISGTEKIQSLNVAVAAGVILSELNRRLGSKNRT